MSESVQGIQQEFHSPAVQREAENAADGDSVALGSHSGVADYSHRWVNGVCTRCDTGRGTRLAAKDCPAMLDRDAETRGAL